MGDANKQSHRMDWFPASSRETDSFLAPFFSPRDSELGDGDLCETLVLYSRWTTTGNVAEPDIASSCLRGFSSGQLQKFPFICAYARHGLGHDGLAMFAKDAMLSALNLIHGSIRPGHESTAESAGRCIGDESLWYTLLDP